jgi:feruloyl esterase
MLAIAAATGVAIAVGVTDSQSALAQAPADAVRAPALKCEKLTALSLPRTTVTLAESLSGGTFTPPETSAGGPGRALTNLPSFCRVTATLRPSPDSDIRIEVWLPASVDGFGGPASGWNGKLQSVGNGAWAGVIPYPALGTALAGGYATAGTDTGHSGNNARFAVGHPEKLADYGYRAVHEMTVAAKGIIAAFYGSNPRLSYWNSCSTGGRQGLMEAQRFPADYDGIIAGAPVYERTRQLTWELWIAQAVHKDDASYIPPAKYPAIHRAALAMCDARDGAADGLIENPLTCRFDPKALECTGGDAPSCLTHAQVEAARKIYAPAVNPRTGQVIYPALQPGSELAWNGLAGPQPAGEAVDLFKYLVFNNEQWDFRTLRFDSAVADADNAAGDVLNATDSNLTPYFDRGGKLLLYHGWNDQLVSPPSTINYYNRVLETTGRTKATGSVRLFMMPGMTHCAGGEGPNAFDKLAVMEQWVERKQVPDRIIATHSADGKIDRTRPLCPYPQIAVYKGAGSIDDESNFACKTP